MIPPGLAFVALSPRALAAMENATRPSFYLDLRKALKSWGKADTPWTPAVSLVVGLDTALQMIREEGVENIWQRHERLATALRAGVSALGLKLFSEAPSFAVTPVWLPAGIDWNAFNTALKADNGITIAGGQGDYAGKIFRVSHLGYYDDLDMITFVAALERTLEAQGYSFAIGAGLAATQRSLLRA